MCIQPYDPLTFSIYRMQESLHLDCLPLIHNTCNIEHIIDDFDLDKNVIEKLLVGDEFQPFSEAERCDIIDYLKPKLTTFSKGF
jgi:hypothetical protein